MILIAAADKNWGIGREGDLLRRISRDMKFFREKTTGNVIVVGRKTLESFPGGKPLPGRTNIVLTRDPSYDGKGAVVVNDLAGLREALASCGEGKEVFVAGGASIYRLLLPYCSRALITKLDAEYPADTWMPDLDQDNNWFLEEEGNPLTEDGTVFRFLTYGNRKTQRL